MLALGNFYPLVGQIIKLFLSRLRFNVARELFLQTWLTMYWDVAFGNKYPMQK